MDRSPLPQLFVCEWIPHININQLKETLHQLVIQYQLKGCATRWILDHADYQSFRIPTLRVPAQEMRAAIRWQIKDKISFPIEEAIVDFYQLPKCGVNQQHHLLQVIVSKKSFLQQLKTLTSSIELQLTHIDIEELVIGSLHSLSRKNTAELSVLRLCPGNNGLFIMSDGHLLFKRWFEKPYLSLFQEEHTESKEKDLIEIYEETTRSFHYYESQLGMRIPSLLEISPVSFDVNPIQTLFESHMPIHVQLFLIENVISMERTFPPDVLMQCATGIGGCLATHRELYAIES